MSDPVRIQRRRDKGWRKPVDAIIVTRPSVWGNPFPVSDMFSRTEAVRLYRDLVVNGEAWHTDDDGMRHRFTRKPKGPLNVPTPEVIRRELAGRDLVCWCPLDEPCHADTLLAIARGDLP